MLEFETKYLERGYRLICGVDEAGRGPLAGPVACGAVILPLDDLIQGVNDSKKLTEKKREELYEKIVEKAIAWNVQLVDSETIDRINILNATKLGMERAVAALSSCPEIVLLDAVKLSLPMPSEAIIHGDALSYSIAAASILAKVTRDRLMLRYDEEFPGYGFSQHKGYGTKLHYEKLQELGMCEIHRRSFLKNL